MSIRRYRANLVLSDEVVTPDGQNNIVQSGTLSTVSTTITFSRAFSTAPVVYLTSSANSTTYFVPQVTATTVSGFTLQWYNQSGTVVNGTPGNLNWLAIGT